MRGQSETIGFILIFSLITVSTGVVYVAGFASVDDARSAEQLNNVERAFEVLDDNFQDVARHGAPSRATELSLSGGRVTLGETTTITVVARYESNGTEIDTSPASVSPIIYRADGTEVVYASGAVLRSDRGNAVMRSDPRWLVTDRRTVLPMLVTSPAPDDTRALSGDTTVLIRGERRQRTVAIAADPPSSRVNVSVTVESSRAAAWGRFLEGSGFDAVDGDPTDGTITYRFVTDELYVAHTETRVRFRQ